MTLVKVCGIIDVESGLAAADSGVDYIGLVFAPIRRAVDLDAAQAIARAVSRRKRAPKIVA